MSIWTTRSSRAELPAGVEPAFDGLELEIRQMPDFSPVLFAHNVDYATCVYGGYGDG